MTPQDRTNHTPLLTFRLPKTEQAEFDENTRRAGTNKSEALVAFVYWYNRKPGAKLPERPPQIDRATALQRRYEDVERHNAGPEERHGK